MTVQELIELLKEQDPQLRVILPGIAQCDSVGDVEVGPYCSDYGTGYLMLLPTEPG